MVRILLLASMAAIAACQTPSEANKSGTLSRQPAPPLAQVHFRFELQDTEFPTNTISCIIPNSLRFTPTTARVQGFYSVSVAPAQDVASNNHAVAQSCANRIRSIRGVNPNVSISHSTQTSTVPWADRSNTVPLAQVHFRFELQGGGFPTNTINCIVPNSLRFTPTTARAQGFYSVSVAPAQDVASNNHAVAQSCASRIRSIRGVNPNVSISHSTQTSTIPWAN